MTYKSIIFDWDGTLGMTLHGWLAAYRQMFSEFGVELADREIADKYFYEHEKPEGLKAFVNSEALPTTYRDFMREVERHMLASFNNLSLYPGVLDALEQAKRKNIDMALVTTSPRSLIAAGLKAVGVDEYFEHVVSFDDVTKLKPDPEPMHKAMGLAGFDPKRTVTMGDSDKDVIASHAAGIDSCLFCPEENKLFYDFEKLKASRPTHVVEHHDDFLSLLLD